MHTMNIAYVATNEATLLMLSMTIAYDEAERNGIRPSDPVDVAAGPAARVGSASAGPARDGLVPSPR